MERVFGLLGAMLLSFVITGTSNATLYDRGRGLIYDSDQNLTWLQDVNYVLTSAPYVADGYITREAAVAWADQLVYGGYNDWRLPTVNDWRYVFGVDGTTTGEYSITTSEMGGMYYENLGNLGLKETGPFISFRSIDWWSGPEYCAHPDYEWHFSFDAGFNGTNDKDSRNYAWAVRPGDVAAVPEPGAVWLLGSGLACVGAACRRKLVRRHG